MATDSNCCCKQDNLKTTKKQPNFPLGERNVDDTAIYIPCYTSIAVITAVTRETGSQTRIQTAVVAANRKAWQRRTGSPER